MKIVIDGKPSSARLWRFLAVVVGILLLVYLVYTVREILLPLGLAFLLATILDPVVDRMEARGYSRQMASAAIFGAFLLIAGGLIWLSIPFAQGEIKNIADQIAKNFPDTSVKGLTQSFHEKFDLPMNLAELAARGVQQGQAAFARSSGSLTRVTLGFAGNLIWLVIVPIVAFYALRDFHVILGKLLLLVPARRREVTQTYIAEVSIIFSRYLRGLGIVSLLNGLATFLVLKVLGMESALLVGVIAGVLYAVPYLGAILTLGLTGAFAFLQGGMPLLIKVMIASVILHQLIFDQIITPRILGGQVGLHPILSIIALLAGNLLLGIVGMILAVPVAACIQIGVLALVPKLRAEIELPKVEVEGAPKDVKEAAALSEEAKTIQIRRDEATADLHESVAQAVTEVEAQVAAMEAADAAEKAVIDHEQTAMGSGPGAGPSSTSKA